MPEDNERVDYEEGAEIGEPVKGEDLPKVRANRAPPREAAVRDKGGGEGEKQQVPEHVPAADETLTTRERGERSER